MNAFLAVAIPPAVYTHTFFAPALPAGVTALMRVALATEKLAALMPSIVTRVAVVKFVPPIVIVVPPRVEPVAGVSEVIFGGAINVNALVLVAVPSGVVTTIVAAPAVPAGVVT